MLKTIANSWALFLGMGFIMLGNGLQGSLLGLRASIEGFSISVTGLIMSGYYIGMIAGSIVVPRIVAQVGHVRTFGALASLASTAILVHLVFLDPIVWWAMRLTTGFAFAGIYIVAESWLNDVADNETRGQLLSFYMLILFGALAGGQFLLNIAPPESFILFILVSALVSIAVIPILVSANKSPAFGVSESVGIRQLFNISPLGVFGIFASGINTGAIFAIGAVYAASAGLGTKEISIFMGSMIIGGSILQYPLGYLSDQVGRRQIIILTSLLSACVFFAMSVVPVGGFFFYAMVALSGGLSLPLYSLCIAHTNDYLNQSQMVAASSTLVLVNGIGAAIGAPLTAYIMEQIGPAGFFQANGVAIASIFLFAVWRAMTGREHVLKEQGEFSPLAPTPISAAFNPDLELKEIESAAQGNSTDIQESFEKLAEELNARDEVE